MHNSYIISSYLQTESFFHLYVVLCTPLRSYSSNTHTQKKKYFTLNKVITLKSPSFSFIVKHFLHIFEFKTNIFPKQASLEKCSER